MNDDAGWRRGVGGGASVGNGHTGRAGRQGQGEEGGCVDSAAGTLICSD